MPKSYIKRILDASVYDVATETPIDEAPQFSARFDNRILLKREDLQPVFSFKLRGAYNKMARLTPAERSRGVITASVGNHAQGVALAAQRLGMRALIVIAAHHHRRPCGLRLHQMNMDFTPTSIQRFLTRAGRRQRKGASAR